MAGPNAMQCTNIKTSCLIAVNTVLCSNVSLDMRAINHLCAMDSGRTSLKIQRHNGKYNRSIDVQDAPMPLYSLCSLLVLGSSSTNITGCVACGVNSFLGLSASTVDCNVPYNPAIVLPLGLMIAITQVCSFHSRI